MQSFEIQPHGFNSSDNQQSPIWVYADTIEDVYNAIEPAKGLVDRVLPIGETPSEEIFATLPADREKLVRRIQAVGKRQGIETSLVICTNHVTKQDNDILQAADEGFPAFRIIRHMYGWIIPIYQGDDPEDVEHDLIKISESGLSDAFKAIYQHALGCGCSYLIFDGSATTLDDFPIFEW